MTHRHQTEITRPATKIKHENSCPTLQFDSTIRIIWIVDPVDECRDGLVDEMNTGGIEARQLRCFKGLTPLIRREGRWHGQDYVVGSGILTPGCLLLCFVAKASDETRPRANRRIQIGRIRVQVGTQRPQMRLNRAEDVHPDGRPSRVLVRLESE
jgi:hypothetical protein